jgi:hypothetical protein
MATHPLIITIAQGCLRAKADDDYWQWFLRKEPSGFDDPCWADLREQLQDGDELWEFCSDERSWDELMGWAGYALVREGAVVGAVVTRQN